MAVTRLTRLRPISFSESASTRRRKGPGSRHLSMTGWPDFTPPQRTAQQLFELAMAEHAHRRSFMDKVTGAGSNVFSGGWHGLEWTFDKIMRPTYAFAGATAATDKAKREGHPGGLLGMIREHDYTAATKGAHAFVRGLKGKEHTTYSDVIKHYRFFRDHKKTTAAAGFGADVLLDPTTYLTFGTTAAAKTGGKAATEAGAKIAAQRAGREAIEGGARNVKQWQGLERKLIVGGEDFKWRKAAAQERKRIAAKKTVDETDRAQLIHVLEAAKREEVGNSARLPFIKIGKLKTPTMTKSGRHLVPSIPRISPVLEKANIPVLSKTIGAFRKGIGSGKTDVIRGTRVTTKHVVEQLSAKYLGDVQALTKHLPKLSKKDAIHALAKFERKGGVKKVVDEHGVVDYVINEARMDKLLATGKITQAQAEYVRTWHKIAQHFYHQDMAFGVKVDHLGEQGKLYVPHLMDRVGTPYTRGEKNMLKKQGYTKGRENTNLSLEHIANLVEEGKLPRNIETDPYKMLVSMARSRAHQHADQSAVDFLSRAMGVPKKIVDDAARKDIAKHQTRMGELAGKMAKYDTPGKKNLKQYKAMAKEHSELESKVSKLMRGKRNKEVSNDMVEIPNLKDEFGHKVLVERDIAEALTRYEKILDPTEDAAITAFSRGWAKMVGRWKLLVTAVNPGYRIRNTMSDFWNMWLAGVPAWAFGRYGARAAKLMIEYKGGKGVSLVAQQRAERIINDAYKAGILSGLYGGDVQTVAHMLQYAGSKKALIKRGRGIKLASKVMQDLNRNGENWGRLVHYLYRREHEHMSVIDSAWEVKKAHFDYEDLTEFERRKLKGNFIPFYTWTRKNVPYQLQALATRPGRYAAFPKFALESEKAAGGDPGTVLPDYMTKNLSFQIPVGEHTYTTPQIGVGDLGRFFEGRQNAMKNAAAMLNPAFKIPAEIITNKSFYTGQEINPSTGHPRSPVSDWAAPLLKLIPGSNVGPTKRGDFVGTGASPWLTYAFGQTPWTRSIFLSGKIKSQQRGYSNWWGQLGGVQITKIDPEQQLKYERIALKDRLKKRMRGLRDEGLYPEAEIQRQSDYERAIQRAIARGMGRP